MSPKKAAKKASELFRDEIVAREVFGKVQLGLEYSYYDDGQRKKAFDLIGSGSTADEAFDHLLSEMEQEELLFPEQDSVVLDEPWEFLAEHYKTHLSFYTKGLKKYTTVVCCALARGCSPGINMLMKASCEHLRRAKRQEMTT